jgi:CubicO group peptidase (beta-lactamase class C family)
MKNRPALKAILLAAAFLLLPCATTPLSAGGRAEYWPADRWRTATPESQGLSSATLAEVFDLVAERDIQVHSIVIVRHGYVVLEAYFYPCAADTLHDVCSCTKSISSTLIGMAIERGRIRSVKETLPELFPGRQWRNDSPAKRRMTLENILTMTTGMDYPLLGEPRLAGMRLAPDMVQAVLDLPMVAEPGTVFGYNSGGSHLLSAIVTARTGQTEEDYARENLFAPLGISAWSWPSTQGLSHGWGDLRLRSTDMARIGYLFLNNGRWGGRHVVSAKWVEEATRPRSNPGGSTRYGYQWWLQKDPARFEALGRAGQRIIVVPGLDVVLVLTGAGYEPDDIGAVIAQSIRSEAAIPEDPQGFALLQRKVASAGAPPAPSPVTPLPETASRVSGKLFALEDNPLKLRAISLSFDGGDTAVLHVLSDRDESWPVGLDGVYRVSAGAPSSSPVGVRGAWKAEREFDFLFNDFTAAQVLRGKAVFQDDGLLLRVEDPWNALDVSIRGILEEQAGRP